MDAKHEHPTTPRQSAARAANARTSRGPKTPAGKANSSMNALKWGFSARQTVLAGESQTEFDAHRARFIDSLQPVGPTEELCVERIADASWRLRRCSAIESQLFFTGLCKEQHDYEILASFHRRLGEKDEFLEKAQAPEYALGRVFSHDAGNGAALSRLSRYEGMLDRILRFALRDLERLQRRRRENPVLQNELTDLVQSKPMPLH